MVRQLIVGISAEILTKIVNTVQLSAIISYIDLGIAYCLHFSLCFRTKIFKYVECFKQLVLVCSLFCSQEWIYQARQNQLQLSVY